MTALAPARPRREPFARRPPGRAARRVLCVLLAPDALLWGHAVCTAAQVGPAGFYPLADRLLKHGWADDDWEQVPYGQDRPPRRFYTLTEHGTDAAAAALRLALPFTETGVSELSAVPAPPPAPYPMSQAGRRVIAALLPGQANATFTALRWLTGLGALRLTRALDGLEDHGWIIPVPAADGPLRCYWLAPGHRAAHLAALGLSRREGAPA